MSEEDFLKLLRLALNTAGMNILHKDLKLIVKMGQLVSDKSGDTTIKDILQVFETVKE